jgi:hypothetical protein
MAFAKRRHTEFEFSLNFAKCLQHEAIVLVLHAQALRFLVKSSSRLFKALHERDFEPLHFSVFPPASCCLVFPLQPCQKFMPVEFADVVSEKTNLISVMKQMDMVCQQYVIQHHNSWMTLKKC